MSRRVVLDENLTFGLTVVNTDGEPTAPDDITLTVTDLNHPDFSDPMFITNVMDGWGVGYSGGSDGDLFVYIDAFESNQFRPGGEYVVKAEVEVAGSIGFKTWGFKVDPNARFAKRSLYYANDPDLDSRLLVSGSSPNEISIKFVNTGTGAGTLSALDGANVTVANAFPRYKFAYEPGVTTFTNLKTALEAARSDITMVLDDSGATVLSTVISNNETCVWVCMLTLRALSFGTEMNGVSVFWDDDVSSGSEYLSEEVDGWHIHYEAGVTEWGPIIHALRQTDVLRLISPTAPVGYTGPVLVGPNPISNLIDDGDEWVLDGGHGYDAEVSEPVDANVVQVSGDTDAADNLEAMFDGTGYRNWNAPAMQYQLHNASAISMATHVEASSVNVSNGTPSGSVANTTERDGSNYSVAAALSVIDFYFEFSIGAGATPGACHWRGLHDTDGQFVRVYARDFVANAWDEIGLVTGSPGAPEVHQWVLSSRHVNASGTVRIRFAANPVSGTLNTDRILVGSAAVAGAAPTVEEINDYLAARHGQGRWGCFHPNTQDNAEQTLYKGVWEHGWMCDDASGNMVAAWGGVNLVATGTPTYEAEGILGPGDKAIEIVAGEYFEAPTTGDFDLDVNDELLLSFAFSADIAAPSAPAINKGVAGDHWRIFYDNTYLRLHALDSPGFDGQIRVNVTYAEMASGMVVTVVIPRNGVDNAKIALMLRDGTYRESFPLSWIPLSAGSVSFSNGTKFHLGTANNPGRFSHVMISTGPSVDGGVAANIETVTRARAAQVFGYPDSGPALEDLATDVAAVAADVDAVLVDTDYLVALGEENLYGATEWAVKVPDKIEVPTAGSRTYRIEVSGIYVDGGANAPINADSGITITLVNQDGTSRAARLDNATMANPSTGTYRAIYTSTAGDPEEQLIWRFSGDITAYNETRDISKWAVSVTEAESSTDVNVVSMETSVMEAIRDTFLDYVHDGTGPIPATVRGLLIRLDALASGKATGLVGSIVRFFMKDGVTVAMEHNQDIAAGTRSTGDIEDSEA